MERIKIIALFLIIFLSWHIVYLLLDFQAASEFFFDRGNVIWSMLFAFILAPVLWILGKRYERVKFYSERDSLTRAFNRRYIYNTFPRLRAKAVRRGQRLGITMIDCNDFKRINDTYGHQTGDRVLQKLAGSLKQHGEKDDVVVRWGGDEFLLIRFAHDDQSSLENVLENVEAQMRDHFKDLKHVEVSVTSGTAVYPVDAYQLRDLIHIADERMYEKKEKKTLRHRPVSS